MWSIKTLSVWLCAGLILCGCSAAVHLPKREGPPSPPRPKPIPQGEALSPFTLLRKISLHVRGQLPTREEYSGLTQAIASGQVQNFLADRLDTYLASDQHIDKMTFRLEELFALRASSVPFYSPIATMGDNNLRGRLPIYSDYPLHNSMNGLFREVTSRNLSWDTLLTGTRYKMFPLKSERDTSSLGDALYFSVAGGVPSHTDIVAPLEFPENDPRIAGVVTTSRFYNRYVNTALNKNRKRAAALFRTFLCDDMKAVVVDEKGNQNEVLDKVFPGQGRGGPGGNGLGDRHGSDPACLKCHYKLDPMGQTFQDSGLILAPLASPGALVFTTTQGQKVNVPVAGVGELGKAITQQPDYVRCQVRHFWRWFIGDDKPLNENLIAELSDKFNEVHRRPNDFIAYLINRPEFGFTESGGANTGLVTEVRSVLQNCNGCHALEKKVPSFTAWPIGGDNISHQRWLGYIKGTLSLDGSTRPRTMPPKASKWQPSPEQLATLQQWFDLGAPNE